MALDFWNPEHVELLKCIGNKRSCDIFEEYFEDNSIVRAEPDSSQQIKEKWIVAKYVNRSFIKLPADCEDLSEEEKFEVIRTMLWDSIEKGDLVECLKALALGALVDDTCEVCDPDVSDVLIQSAIQRSSHLKYWNLVALLLLWGADAEYCDSLGRNLIHYLASIPDSSISVLLSILRKNPSLGGWSDSEGRTPLQYAEVAQNAPVATIIRVFQAQLDEDSASSKGGPGGIRIINNVASGQDSPGSVCPPKTPTTTTNSTTLSSAFEKVLQFTNRGPFKRKK